MSTNSGTSLFKLTLITAMLVMAMVSTASAANYYVDANGNDSASGAQATPFRTLSRACAVARAAGDNIYINAGTYSDNSGCDIAPGVNIVGAGRDKVTIKSSYGDWYINGFSTSIVNGNQKISGFTLDGNGTALAHGIRIVGRHNVTFENLGMVNIRDTALKVQGMDDWAGSDWSFQLGNVPPGYATNNVIRDVITKNCAVKALQSAIWLTALQDSLVENVTVDESAAVGGRGNAIKAWPGFLKHSVIRNSTFIVNPGNGEPIPMEIWDWQDDSEVYGCTFKGGYLSLVSGNKGAASWALRFHDNVVDGTGLPGAGHEFALSDMDVYNNYFIDYGVSVWITGHGWTAGGRGINNVRIRNNVITNPAPYGIYLLNQASGDGPLSNIQVYNNVIDGGRGTYGSKMGIVVQPSGYANSGLKIQNNIIANQNTAISIGGNVPSPVITNNDFFNAGGVSGGSGTISNNRTVDPMFAGTGTTVFQRYALKAGSPMIDTGVNVGLPFTGSAPDLGAVETGTTSTVLAAPANLRAQ